MDASVCQSERVGVGVCSGLDRDGVSGPMLAVASTQFLDWVWYHGLTRWWRGVLMHISDTCAICFFDLQTWHVEWEREREWEREERFEL